MNHYLSPYRTNKLLTEGAPLDTAWEAPVEEIDKFAELLSRGIDPGPAAVALGLSESRGPKLLKEIRDELGSKAK